MLLVTVLKIEEYKTLAQTFSYLAFTMWLVAIEVHVGKQSDTSTNGFLQKEHETSKVYAFKMNITT